MKNKVVKMRYVTVFSAALSASAAVMFLILLFTRPEVLKGNGRLFAVFMPFAFSAMAFFGGDCLYTEAYLNKNGKNGLKLVKMTYFEYVFEKVPEKEFSYFSDYTKSIPSSAENQPIISEYENNGAVLCDYHAGYMYFAYEKNDGVDFPLPKQRYERISKRFRVFSRFWLIMSAFMTLLSVYNIIWKFKFDDMNYLIPYDSDQILKIFKDLVTDENPATLLLYLLIPITAFCFVLAAYFICLRVSFKSHIPVFEEETDENEEENEQNTEEPGGETEYGTLGLNNTEEENGKPEI